MKPVVGARTTRQVTFVGPFGVGKTTAVFTLCGESVTASEVRSSLVSERRGRRVKPTTTVGLEIGEWVAPDGRSVNVVGTPSQERFDMVRRSAMPRSAGVVLWLFGDQEHAELDARLWLEFILQEVPAERLAIALTRLNDPVADLARFRTVLGRVNNSIPVLAADPRDADTVAELVAASLRIAPDAGQDDAEANGDLPAARRTLWGARK